MTNNPEEDLSKYKEMIKSLPGAVYQFLVKPDKTCYIIFISEKIEELTGINPKECIGELNKTSKYLHKEDFEIFHRSIENTINTLDKWECEFRVVAKNGKTTWLRGLANPKVMPDKSVLWNGVLLDITKRKYAEIKLQENEQNLTSVFNNMQDVYFRTDQNRKIIWYTPSGEKLLGYKKEDVIGKEISDFYEDKSLSEKLFRILKKGGTINDYEIDIKKVNGEIITVSVNVVNAIDNCLD